MREAVVAIFDSSLAAEARRPLVAGFEQPVRQHASGQVASHQSKHSPVGDARRHASHQPVQDLKVRASEEIHISRPGRSRDGRRSRS